MFKKINMIIVFFCSVLTVRFDIGFMFFLPLLLFYVLKDAKNVYYAIPASALAIVFFSREHIIPYVVMIGLVIAFLATLYVLTNRQAKIVRQPRFLIIGFLFIANLFLRLVFYIGPEDILLSCIINAIGILLYLYFEKYLYKMLLDITSEQEAIQSSLAYLEIMIAIIGVLGAVQITLWNVNLGFIVGIFWSMYFGRSYKNIYALLFSITIMLIELLGFHIPESIFIPFVSALYFISHILLMVVFNLFLVTIIFSETAYTTNALIAMMACSIVFEMLCHILVKEKQTDKDIFEYIYGQIQKNTNDEILSFATFLDQFSVGFRNPKEYNERLSDGIKTIVQNHCRVCPKMKECFDCYKIELYPIFKSILLQEETFRDSNKDFIEYCPKVRSIEQTAKLLQARVQGVSEEYEQSKTNNNALIAQINGVSNAIKNYVLDMTSKAEMSYYTIMLAKKRLLDYGYDITYFEVKRFFEDDFLFVIGIKGKTYHDAKDTIKLLTENIIHKKVSIVLQNEERGTIYINVIPEIKIDITYGYGALSCEGNDICGDNYLIKDLDNGHFISAISDGMGKGYSAFYESDMTLRLVEDIIQLNLDSSTALSILNTFYAVQDYLERYATLDFLEINRYNEIAHFYKMGATTTYIFRSNGTIDKIINKCLPFGIEDEIDNCAYQLHHGDLILMSSDGIFENLIDENKLQGFIDTIRDLPPQKIVYELLNYTIHNKVKTSDDMSIIALKIQHAI